MPQIVTQATTRRLAASELIQNHLVVGIQNGTSGRTESITYSEDINGVHGASLYKSGVELRDLSEQNRGDVRHKIRRAKPIEQTQFHHCPCRKYRQLRQKTRRKPRNEGLPGSRTHFIHTSHHLLNIESSAQNSFFDACKNWSSFRMTSCSSRQLPRHKTISSTASCSVTGSNWTVTRSGLPQTWRPVTMFLRSDFRCRLTRYQSR